MRSIARALAAIASFVAVAAALAGCAPSFVVGPLPDLDARLVAGCGTAPALAGEDPRVSARRKELARRCEAGKRRALVGFYEGLRANRGADR
jgi:hypothetical protein